MKKILSLICFSLVSIFLFAESYKIIDVNYDISGCRGISFGKTNPISLEIKCPIDKTTVFDSKESFDIYIKEYNQQLKNLRAFSSIDVAYNSSLNQETLINEVTLNVTLVDSSHLLALPYPKYDSNSGFNLKIKAKDTNFLGTLNPLATDLYVNYNELDNLWAIGFNFSYDYPFKAGIFNASWENSLNLDYIIGEENPTFKTIIGVGFTLPKDYFSINFGAYQTIGFSTLETETPTDVILTDKDRYFYFKEHVGASLPIILYKAPNFSTVKYSPYADFMFSWDLHDIKDIEPIKEGMALNFGHSISNSKINWNDCFRKGYSVSLDNDFTYKFNTDFPIATVSLEGELFYNFKIMDKNFLDRFGINSRLFAFTTIDIPGRGTKEDFSIGSRMRGILNDDLSAPYGVVLNLDIPINIITTDFKHDFFNFTMQFSPFVDVAMTSDYDEKGFNLNTHNLTTGLEVLVYPHKFSSYTIRGSVGFDVKSAKDENNFLKGLWHNKEIYIGLDIHY